MYKMYLTLYEKYPGVLLLWERLWCAYLTDIVLSHEATVEKLWFQCNQCYVSHMEKQKDEYSTISHYFIDLFRPAFFGCTCYIVWKWWSVLNMVITQTRSLTQSLGLHDHPISGLTESRSCLSPSWANINQPSAFNQTYKKTCSP